MRAVAVRKWIEWRKALWGEQSGYEPLLNMLREWWKEEIGTDVNPEDLTPEQAGAVLNYIAQLEWSTRPFEVEQ